MSDQLTSSVRDVGYLDADGPAAMQPVTGVDYQR